MWFTRGDFAIFLLIESFLMSRPEKSEYDAYYERYVSRVIDSDIIDTLASQSTKLADMFATMPEERGDFQYEDGKWSIKESLGHLIDAERIFAYRVLRISRGDETPIEGFEQDGYIENAYFNRRSFSDLLEEFSLSRRANLLAINNLNDDGWTRIGTASNAKVSVRALIYIMAGHIEHHLAIFKEKYSI